MVIVTALTISRVPTLAAAGAPMRLDAPAPRYPVVWLAPLDATSPDDRGEALSDEYAPAPDFMALFDPDTPWKRVAGRTQFFKVYARFVHKASDADLRRVVRALTARHIALAMETPVLRHTVVCKPGAGGFDPVMPAVQRLAAAGAPLAAIAMNGPLAAGHTNWSPGSCNAPIEAVAQDAAQAVKDARSVFPNLLVGDIEPLGHREEPGHWAETIAKWLGAFESASGRRLDFLHLDVGWGGDWRGELRDVVAVARAASVPVGVIYDGDEFEMSDEAWANDTREHYEAVESEPGRPPEQVVFQSWNRNPSRALPESDWRTMTGIVRNWMRDRTRIRQVSGHSGEITTEAGRPLAGARLVVEANDAAAAGGMLRQSVSGTVPEGTTAALFGLRIHTECHCSGARSSIDVASFRYMARGAAPFDWSMRSWQSKALLHVSSAPLDGLTTVRIDAAADVPLLLNGVRFPVRPGQHFNASFDWRIPQEADDTGFAVLVFLGPDGIERARTIHRMRTTWHERYRLRADSRGRFTWPATRHISMRIRYGGDIEHRPAALVVGQR